MDREKHHDTISGKSKACWAERPRGLPADARPEATAQSNSYALKSATVGNGMKDISILRPAKLGVKHNRCLRALQQQRPRRLSATDEGVWEAGAGIIGG